MLQLLDYSLNAFNTTYPGDILSVQVIHGLQLMEVIVMHTILFIDLM